jgi:sugar phosphate isomerase/epimerase
MRSYRLGSTSFVYPGSWRHNVERLAGRVQDIELLFFEVDGPDALPQADELAALAALKAQHQLSYSLHTPLAASLASGDDARRRDGVRMVRDALTAASGLRPEAYVVHVYQGDQEHDGVVPSDLDAWRRRAARSLHEILALGVPAERLCVELIDYDFALIEPVVSELGLSIALDIGHLHRDGRKLRDNVLRYLPRTRLIQWHGTEPNGRDHRSLAHFPQADALWLLQTLQQQRYAGVLTLEVFRPDDFESSLALTLELEERAQQTSNLDQNSMPR